MDAVTYPTEAVGNFIMENLVPLRLANDDVPFADKYSVFWTPSLLILDTNGGVYQRTIGFFEPDELIAVLLLGIAKVSFAAGKLESAKLNLDRLLDQYRQSGVAPEAIYFHGITRYKMSSDPNELKKAYQRLQEEHPESTWAGRAAPYRLL